MQVAFIYGKQPSATLTRIFTGSTCYHVGFTDGVYFWDMHKTRRRQAWGPYSAARKHLLVEAPVPVTAEYLDAQWRDQSVRYGWRDYVLFSLRWAYHLVGKSTRNYGGEICSEWVGDVLRSFGWSTKFPEVESPADLELQLLGRKDAISPEGAKCGLIVNPGALWLGAHWSPANRRWCINVLPCVTLWVALPGGKVPERATR